MGARSEAESGVVRLRPRDREPQFLTLLRIGDVLHPLGRRPGDDLRTLEELIAPDVVRVFVRVDDAFRQSGPHLLNISITCRACAISIES